MRRIACVLACVVSAFAVLACFQAGAVAAEPGDGTAAHGLALSDRTVSVTSEGRTATFRLYDTRAAREFYDQLPLTLPLENFRDAQWMFYPPEKLSVTAREAYHDGRKGELSYYAPWGDVFMLYRDFHAGDEMHRLGVGLTGIDDIQSMSGDALVQKIESQAAEADTAMHITVTANGITLVYELNDSQAARDLVAQLPMNIEVENHGGIEKIFYPPKKLTTAETPLARNVQAGTLAYYAPWGDVVLFYDRFRPAAGLYELGRVVSGGESIRDLSGNIRIEKGETQ